MLVATAGHVDHGKTSLIKNLTGINTDRLAEEKQRGLSIELGYAFYNAGANEPIGFIDVPGHHRFINTMISGINGIDLGLLVVAADDGPMPQTLEHLQLLHALGVNNFVGVISKVDLVEPARVNEVVDATRALIPNAEIYIISNSNKQGISELLDYLKAQARSNKTRPSEQQFRLYIDRVFTKKGAGLVVTGTSLSGTVTMGDELQLHTASGDTAHKIGVKVRDIHAQGASATTAHAGQRCALNLAGKVSTDRVHRGDFLCANASAVPARRMDTRYWPLESSPRELKHLGRVKLYIGTRRLSAKTYLLDRGLSDGRESSLNTTASGKHLGQRVQLILDKGVVAFAGDRFVIRDDNELATLGGGLVLDPEAPQWGKSRASRLQQLSALELADPKLALEQLLFTHNDIVSLNRWRRIWNLSGAEIEELLDTPALNAEHVMRLAVANDQLVMSLQLWKQYCQQLQQTLASWHAARPMEAGIKLDELTALLRGQIPAQLLKPLFDHTIASGQVIISDNRAHALGHRPTLSSQVQKDWQRLESYMTQRGLNLALRSEIQKDAGFDARQLEQLTRPALKRAALYAIGEKRLALPATLFKLANLIEQAANGPDGISVIEAKQLFGLGRNLTIEIMEFFDEIGYTKRVATARKIQNPDAARKILQSSNA